MSTIFNINDITNGHIREVLGRQVREGTGDAAETGETGDTREGGGWVRTIKLFNGIKWPKIV